jgi:Response regulator containing CheY-like receiver, AAA-type ATPase, and DNA-binding domains
MKILVADDSITIRRIITGALTELGYDDLVEVDCGDDALAALRDQPDIALVLLDWNMPLTNGFECLKTIRAAEATRNLPVIMITAESQKSRVVEAIQQGASNYLVKPFSRDKLRDVINDTLKI